jgi:hypothetical protein
MKKRIIFTEDQKREAKERMKRIDKLIMEGLRKASELGIQDMTQSEAEKYLKEKEEKENSKNS